MGLLQSLIARELSLFDLSGRSLEDPTWVAVSDSELTQFEIPFP